MFEDPFFRQAVWMAGGDVTDGEDEHTGGCMCGALASGHRPKGFLVK